MNGERVASLDLDTAVEQVLDKDGDGPRTPEETTDEDDARTDSDDGDHEDTFVSDPGDNRGDSSDREQSRGSQGSTTAPQAHGGKLHPRSVGVHLQRHVDRVVRYDDGAEYALRRDDKSALGTLWFADRVRAADPRGPKAAGADSRGDAGVPPATPDEDVPY